MSHGAKEVVYRQGINLLRSVAVEILEEANTLFLHGTGNMQMIGPEEDGSGGLVRLAGFPSCIRGGQPLPIG